MERLLNELVEESLSFPSPTLEATTREPGRDVHDYGKRCSISLILNTVGQPSLRAGMMSTAHLPGCKAADIRAVTVFASNRYSGVGFRPYVKLTIKVAVALPSRTSAENKFE